VLAAVAERLRSREIAGRLHVLHALGMGAAGQGRLSGDAPVTVGAAPRRAGAPSRGRARRAG
jgi:hypothetical protein